MDFVQLCYYYRCRAFEKDVCTKIDFVLVYVLKVLVSIIPVVEAASFKEVLKTLNYTSAAVDRSCTTVCNINRVFCKGAMQSTGIVRGREEQRVHIGRERRPRELHNSQLMKNG